MLVNESTSMNPEARSISSPETSHCTWRPFFRKGSLSLLWLLCQLLFILLLEPSDMESWLTEITHKLPTAKSKDLFPHSYRTRFCPAFYIIDHPFSWNLSSLPSFHALSCFSPSPSAHSFSLSSASPLSLCSFSSENSLFQGCNPHPHPYLPPLKSHHPWLFS